MMRLWPLIPVLLLGLALRATNLDYGLPALFHADEPLLMGPARAS